MLRVADSSQKWVVPNICVLSMWNGGNSGRTNSAAPSIFQLRAPLPRYRARASRTAGGSSLLIECQDLEFPATTAVQANLPLRSVNHAHNYRLRGLPSATLSAVGGCGIQCRRKSHPLELPPVLAGVQARFSSRVRAAVVWRQEFAPLASFKSRSLPTADIETPVYASTTSWAAIAGHWLRSGVGELQSAVARGGKRISHVLYPSEIRFSRPYCVAMPFHTERRLGSPNLIPKRGRRNAT